jgi:hypothetical protein
MNWENKSVIRLMREYNIDDPVIYIKDKVRELVLIAFDKGWTGPPFNPLKLAQLLDIEVMPNEKVLDARILPMKGNKATIEYNPYQKHSRINFSISHEIGHTFFPDFKEKIRNREEDLNPENKELEFLCNIAAAEILLPYSEFSNEANRIKLDLKSLIEISNKYQASLESVFLRFCDVVDKPCAVIIGSFSEDLKDINIDYFKPSKTFKKVSNTKIKIPKTSKAFQCINSGWSDESIENWTMLGSDLKFYFIGLSPYRRTKNQRVGIFIVPLIYDERPLKYIKEILGDATLPRALGNKIIVQLLNSSGATGIGFGKSMAVKWPESKKTINKWKTSKDFFLGNSKLTRLDEDVYVFQMIAQKGLYSKNDEPLIRYSILRKCLKDLAVQAKTVNASVHMPRIGAGQAKGDWELISGIIHDELIQKEIDVTVYTLPGQEIKKAKPNSLTLFDETNLYER